MRYTPRIEPAPPVQGDGGTLTVQPDGRTMAVPPGRTLLEAALAAGLALNHSCRSGSCRACRCKLAAGQVRYRIAWPSLSSAEKAEGWILPCVALAEGPVVIDAAAGSSAPR